MGVTINEKIKTELDYQDVCLIAVAFGMYQEKFKKTAEKDVLQRMERLVNRLGQEMYAYPKSNFTKNNK